jgi:hypothetical protein
MKELARKITHELEAAFKSFQFQDPGQLKSFFSLSFPIETLAVCVINR